MLKTILLLPMLSAMFADSIHSNMSMKVSERRLVQRLNKIGASYARDRRAAGKPINAISCSGFDATDEDVRLLRHCQTITSLSIHFPPGNVTKKALPYVAEMKSLRELDLMGVPLTDVDLQQLSQLKQLRRILVAGHPGAAISEAGLAQFRMMGQLESLHYHLATIKADGFSHLKKLERLRTLDFTNSHLDLKQINGTPLVQVRKLILDGSNVTDEYLGLFGKWSKLEELSLVRTSVKGKGLSALLPLKTLQYLDVGQSALNDTGVVCLSKLTQLRSLSLYKCGVTDSCLDPLSALRRLRYVDLRGTEISAKGIEVLKSRLPYTVIVHD